MEYIDSRLKGEYQKRTAEPVFRKIVDEVKRRLFGAGDGTAMSKAVNETHAKKKRTKKASAKKIASH